MDEYKIKKAYHWTKDKEIEISSENLLFTEMVNLSGCQSRNMKNNKEIQKRCLKIADLIREIDELNVGEPLNTNSEESNDILLLMNKNKII